MWIRDRLPCFLDHFLSLTQGLLGTRFLLVGQRARCNKRALVVVKGCVIILRSFALVRLLSFSLLYLILVDCVHMERISSSGLYFFLWFSCLVKLGFLLFVFCSSCCRGDSLHWWLSPDLSCEVPVSYTHLTLPTILLV